MSCRYDEFLRYQNLVPFLAKAVREAEDGDPVALIELILELLGLTADEATTLHPELQLFLCPKAVALPADD